MQTFQKEIQLSPKPRGFHLITNEVLAHLEEIQQIKIGILHLFIKHTSASLTINENADYTVREDFESHINKMVPENMPYYKHNYEGADDMPAHIKASLCGHSVQIPISKGNLCFGTWQGIYLGEHRNRGGSRRLVVTIIGKRQ
ncbi:secondary thiamine-phosphate synthase enzyme YjbQ [Winogradskyella vincentii]|uniref:Secondary thiamine-phosphate synthase enzyme YjbQ n=1 Tax=Winogradskyella vincentii TaxID=2877122 RepID=A0ABS7Y3Q3_9FLAO|nr:secondary thiamine-phosphate synthase enzyme YjbQ [Winogradskyella vincentii]MCA0153257.1 secondary thiamine-phosphate synthase enzyme YjbQ [Winogradskyella vincentii]